MTLPREAPPDPWQHRWQQLVNAIVRVHAESGEQQLLEWLSRPDEPVVLAFLNAHAMNAAAVSKDFFNAVLSADLVLRDGQTRQFTAAADRITGEVVKVDVTLKVVK